MFSTFTTNTLLALIAAVATFAFQCPKALAHSHHTANYCSTTAPDVCAHLGFSDEPNTMDEAVFMLDFAPSKANVTQITNVTVKLVMEMSGMQHSGSPVTITPADAAHYEVSKAYFSMTGQWQVKAGFDFGGAKHEVIIPIDVK